MSSNTKKIIILVVIILILSALMSAICGISTLGIRLFKSNHDSSAQAWTLNERFSDIRVSSKTSDIRILQAPDGKPKVEWTGNGTMKLNVKVRNGELSVEERNRFPIFRFLNITSGDPVIKVYLPKGNYEKIDAESDTGSVSVNSVSAENLDAESDTGSVRLTDVNVSREAEAKTDVGRVELTNLSCGTLDAHTDTGSITMTNVIAAGALKAESDTGSIRLDRCDAASLDLKSDTGSITGTLLSSKIFVTKTDLGRISVPDTTSGGTCRAETSIGSIELSVIR